jgi:hypothetical protein
MPRLLPVVFLVLVAAAAPSLARADGGPSPGVSADGVHGVADRRTGLTYSALDGTNDTFVVVRGRDGRQVRSGTVAGNWGIPFVTWDLTRGGLSHDGSRLVLANPPAAGLARRSTLLVLDTATLRPTRRIVLPGDYAFDALSPDKRTLFLIQHTSSRDFQRYRVRAYDLVRGVLKPHAIVDKTEPNMAGQPIRRLVGPGARWIYTLYMHENEYFVHALDTVHARARCLDVEWHGKPNALTDSRLALQGRRLALLGRDGRELTSIALPPNTRKRSWKAAAGTAAALLVAFVGLGALMRFRRSRRANALSLGRFERPQTP